MRLALGTTLLVVIALATSACGSSHGVSAQTAHLQIPATVPASLASYIRTAVRSADGTVSSVDVYGPGSRTDLVKASSGDIVNESAKEKAMRFYLVVMNGNFVCNSCSGPMGSKPPRGSVETDVWSAEERGTDFGIGDRPGSVSHLHRLATIAVS